MNDQRRVIFEQRKDMMRSEDLSELVADMRHEVIDEIVAKFIPAGQMQEQWDWPGLHEEALRVLNLDLPVKEWAAEEGIAEKKSASGLRRPRTPSSTRRPMPSVQI